MPGLLTTIFASNDVYLASYISSMNKGKSFPVKNHVDNHDFISNTLNDSIIVSGGSDEERSALLLGLVKNISGCVVFVHNGNDYISVEHLHRYGINADICSEESYSSSTKAQLLSVLVANNDDDLAIFYAYAMEICEVLNKPMTVQGMRSIDWLSGSWQQDLLCADIQKSRIFDLLNRFDRSMAEKATRGVCRLERFTGTSINEGINLQSGLDKGGVVIKEVYGSNSPACKLFMEMLQAEAEKGKRFTLVLDDVYMELPIIKDNFRNVRMILSGSDVSQYREDLRLTNRSYSVVAFNHSNFSSCKKISETYFGEYDKLISEISRGHSKGIFESKTYNKSVTFRQSRDTRLKPEMISAIPAGFAFVHTVNGTEGYISIIQEDRSC